VLILVVFDNTFTVSLAWEFIRQRSSVAWRWSVTGGIPTQERSSLYTNVTKLVIPAWTAGIQATWTYLKLPFLALDTRFPAGMTVT